MEPFRELYIEESTDTLRANLPVGRIPDSFLTAIGAMRKAIKEGMDVGGCFEWSLLNNFEWASGYRPTFGLRKADFGSQKRIPKDSFCWYCDLIKTRKSR
jgi:beta-glucosidase/6-phospho-beta-glucosidase/beta-galactosidase